MEHLILSFSISEISLLLTFHFVDRHVDGVVRVIVVGVIRVVVIFGVVGK